MEINGDYEFEAPLAVVWEALQDPEVLARTLPGCEKLEQTGPNRFDGTLKMKVGPVQGVFEGGVELLNLKALEGYDLKIDGQGPGGFMNGSGTVGLEDLGNDRTRLTYTIDARVGGRIASVGQRLLESSAKLITRQGLKGLDKQIVELAAATPPETKPAAGDSTKEPPPAMPEPVAAEHAPQAAPKSEPESSPTQTKSASVSPAFVVINLLLFGAAVSVVLLRACG